MCNIPSLIPVVDDSESVDIKAVVSCIKEEIHKKSTDIKSLFDFSIGAASAIMFEAGLISHAVMKFNHHLMSKESLPDILEHCEKFFQSFFEPWWSICTSSEINPKKYTTEYSENVKL